MGAFNVRILTIPKYIFLLVCCITQLVQKGVIQSMLYLYMGHSENSKLFYFHVTNSVLLLLASSFLLILKLHESL